MKELKNGEYVLTMKDSDKVIFNAIPINGYHLAYRPDKEYQAQKSNKLVEKNIAYSFCGTHQ